MLEYIKNIPGYKAGNHPRKWHQVILWWEIRRIPYNIIMLLAGLVSFYIAYITIPLIYFLIGAGLNVFYTLGWIIELAVTYFSNNKQNRFAPFAYITILIISISIVFGWSFLIFYRFG